jgi:hypothetical protein
MCFQKNKKLILLLILVFVVIYLLTKYNEHFDNSDLNKDDTNKDDINKVNSIIKKLSTNKFNNKKCNIVI